MITAISNLPQMTAAVWARDRRIILLTALTTAAALKILDAWLPYKPVEYTKRKAFLLLMCIPKLQRTIQKEMDRHKRSIEKDLFKARCEEKPLKSLPECSKSKDEVTEIVRKKLEHCGEQANQGKVSGTLYHGGKELTELMTEVFSMAPWSNPLHSDLYPEIVQMEAEVVRITCNLFHGGPASCGTMTSGGTNSIFHACLAYCRKGREEGIQHPEMVIPDSAHAAFEKAADVMEMKVVKVPVDPATSAADVEAMKRAVTRNTVMLVGSAPSYPHGIIDPIAELGKVAIDKGIGLHVDACLGGYLIPFCQDIGYHLPPFDFRVDGVTSISCDTHKYAYSPKGSSVIMYKNEALMQRQFFVNTTTSIGVYATPTLEGSRPGVVIAQTWAALQHFGKAGYTRAAARILDTREKLQHEINKLPDIEVAGNPLLSVLGLRSQTLDIYRIHDAMTRNGWSLNPLQNPASIHFCLTSVHAETKEFVETFIRDLNEAVNHVRNNPQENKGSTAELYSTKQKIPTALIDDLTRAYLAMNLQTEPRRQSP